MALLLPFQPSIPFYTFSTTIENVEYLFNVRWNGRDGAWYFDVSEVDNTPIVSGVKVVLGCFLARATDHALFRDGVLVTVDTSDAGRDAGFDDLGTRVQVMRLSLDEVLSLRVNVTYPDAVELAKL